MLVGCTGDIRAVKMLSTSWMSVVNRANTMGIAVAFDSWNSKGMFQLHIAVTFDAWNSKVMVQLSVFSSW